MHTRRTTTLLPYTDRVDNLQIQHTKHDCNRAFNQNFTAAEIPTRATQTMFRTWGTQTKDEELNAEWETESCASASPLARVAWGSPPNQKWVKSTRTNSRIQCRKCGNEYAANEWISFHTNNITDETDWTGWLQSWVLQNGTGNKVWEVCTVQELLYQPGFPCTTKVLPRQKRTCEKNLWHN